jgi:hypothetical protein
MNKEMIVALVALWGVAYIIYKQEEEKKKNLETNK